LQHARTGNQACQITSGTDYAVNEFDVWNYSWIKWVFLAVVICYWFIWNTLAFLALCYVRYVHDTMVTTALSCSHITLLFICSYSLTASCFV
jgi:hypothetical protein